MPSIETISEALKALHADKIIEKWNINSAQAHFLYEQPSKNSTGINTYQKGNSTYTSTAHGHVAATDEDFRYAVEHSNFIVYPPLDDNLMKSYMKYFNEADNLAKWSKITSRNSDSKSAVFHFKGAKYENQACNYKYRQSKLFNLDEIEEIYGTDILNKIKSKWGSQFYDVVIYKDDESDDPDILTFYCATSGDLKKLGGYKFEGDSGLSDNEAIKSKKNKLVILDTLKALDDGWSINAIVCPISKIWYKNRGNNNSVTLAAWYDCNANREISPKQDSNNRIKGNGDNKYIDDAKNSLEIELIRKYIEDSGRTYRTTIVNSIISFWVTDSIDFNRQFESNINYYMSKMLRKNVNMSEYDFEQKVELVVSKKLNRCSNMTIEEVGTKQAVTI